MIRLATLALVILSMLLAPSRAFGSTGGAPSGCTSGWTVVAKYDNSFVWQGVGLPLRSVSWTGAVWLKEKLDSNCYVVGIRLDYTGPTSGGTLVVNGNPFVSYTVQDPDPFTDYANVGTNAYGNLRGYTPTHPAVQPRYDINARGADELRVQGSGGLLTISGLTASFTLPLDLLGSTVYAQIHVGTNLCQCSVTGVPLPGSAPPPPPPPPPPPSQPWDVFVHGHEDDWQLFESPDSYSDYQNGHSLLFIHTTAGDAGQGQSYWAAREQADQASVKVLAGQGLTETSGSFSVCYTAQVQICHNVWRWTYGTRTTSVYMRLPDGGVQGGGFPSTNYETLSKLRDGQIGSITTVDASTRYDGWSDFTSTLAAVINAYAPHDSTTVIHAPDFDRTRQTTQVYYCQNCSDHADHLATADAIYAITIGAGAPWTLFVYIDYPIAYADARYPENLNATEYDIKKQLFMAYNDKMKNLTGVDTYAGMPWFWENCFHRQYSRNGAGSSAPPSPTSFGSGSTQTLRPVPGDTKIATVRGPTSPRWARFMCGGT